MGIIIRDSTVLSSMVISERQGGQKSGRSQVSGEAGGGQGDGISESPAS